MGLTCSASSVEIKSNNTTRRPSILEQTKSYSLSWEKENKAVSNSRTCCFCWCCLCTCLCKSRIIRGTKISAIDSNSSFSQIDLEDLFNGIERRPTAEQIYKWAEDFESMLCDKAGRTIFEKFLQQEYSDENLLFWTEVERMKSMEEEGKRLAMVKTIYKTFIEPRSEKEVNIEFRIRKNIEQNMEKPPLEIFDTAQTQVYVMMYRQSYPRFLSSRIYQALLNQAIPKNGKKAHTKEGSRFT